MCYVNRSIPASMTNRREWQVPSSMESLMESRSTKMTKNHGSCNETKGRGAASTGGNKRDIVFQRASNVQRPIVSVPFFHFSFLSRRKSESQFSSFLLHRFISTQCKNTERVLEKKLKILTGGGGGKNNRLTGSIMMRVYASLNQRPGNATRY